MKTLINGILLLVFVLLAPQIIKAQGAITYLSNVGQASAGALAVGSDSWWAAGFFAGHNSSGYSLNSIQLDMIDATGSPSGFTVMLYTSHASGSVGTSIETLDGSLSPVAGGIYTYTPVNAITLSPGGLYYIVLNAGTTIANGAYEWNGAGANSYNPIGTWGSGVAFFTSSDGSSWGGNAGGIFPEFAITATVIPEPSPSVLLLLGSGIFTCVRRAFRL